MHKVAAPAAPAPCQGGDATNSGGYCVCGPAPAGTHKGKVDVECEVLVLGAGPGGLLRGVSVPPTSA